MLAEAYKYFRWLSLDIVLGAILFLAFFEQHYELTFTLSIYFALGSAIFLIYNTDHLIDSLRYDGSPRRSFHKRRKNAFILILGLTLALAMLNVYFLPTSLIRNGAVLMAVCVVYLMLVYFVHGFWVKEILVAFGYSSGLFLAPATLTDSIGVIDLILWLQLAVVALINLLIFSIYDFEEDERGKFPSLAMRLGLLSVRRLLFLFSATLLSSCGLIVFFFPQLLIFQMLYSAIVSTLLLVAYFPSYFSQYERFRILGDAVFYLPLVFLLF